MLDYLVAIGYGGLSWLFVHKVGLPGVLATVLVTVGTALTRRCPLLALAVTLPVFLTPTPYLAVLPVTAALAVAAARCRIRVALVALAVAMSGPVAIALPRLAPTGAIAPFELALVAGWAAGFALGQHRRYTDELLRREAQAERLRIARELHDVVAHGMSVITVQAAFGRLVIDDQPATAADALATIETTGRDTLTELRRLLGVLRSDDQPALAPVPGLSGLDDLVDRTARAGVRVSLTINGTPRDLPAGIDLAAYRIMQEALTNVVRHAGTSTARATIDYGPTELAIDIVDAGRGGPVRSGGHGLVGMRERAALCGGRLRAEPLPGSGFLVAARLPLS